MAFKILSKKNGKRTISDDKSNDTIKVTKVLQFLTETEPKEAKIGAIVRFMWNPGNGTNITSRGNRTGGQTESESRT